MNGEKNSPTGDSGEMMRHWFEMASEATAACQKWAVNQVSPSLKESFVSRSTWRIFCAYF
jgi:hypothetical protein